MELTEDISKMIMYRYIIEDGKLLLLNPDNIKDYIGKKIKLRSPLYCKDDKFCSKCSGELYYMLNLENVGLTANRVGTLKNDSYIGGVHNIVIYY